MAEEKRDNMKRTTAPFRVEDVPWEEWSQGERFGSRFRALGQFGGCAHFGTAIEELPAWQAILPGAFPHARRGASLGA